MQCAVLGLRSPGDAQASSGARSPQPQDRGCDFRVAEPAQTTPVCGMELTLCGRCAMLDPACLFVTSHHDTLATA